MAVILYKAGGTSKVNGIPCEVQICNEFSYLHLLEQGWFYTPEECYAETEQEEGDKTGPEETLEEELETEEEPKKSADVEIRTAAKDAGISHWHTKSIDRLKNELKDLEDAEQPED